MRVNVYNEEFTNEIVIVSKTTATGDRYWGVRFYLKSPLDLQTDDDDRSAVTFWSGKVEDLCSLINRANNTLDSALIDLVSSS